MSQSTGPLDREDFQGVNGVMLPNEEVGAMILDFFVDLREEVIFVIIQGGFESAYFNIKDQIYFIENIEMVGVMLDDYMNGLDHLLGTMHESPERPMPPHEQVRDQLLTRAKVRRSQSTN